MRACVRRRRASATKRRVCAATRCVCYRPSRYMPPSPAPLPPLILMCVGVLGMPSEYFEEGQFHPLLPVSVSCQRSVGGVARETPQAEVGTWSCALLCGSSCSSLLLHVFGIFWGSFHSMRCSPLCRVRRWCRCGPTPPLPFATASTTLNRSQTLSSLQELHPLRLLPRSSKPVLSRIDRKQPAAACAGADSSQNFGTKESGKSKGSV
jgi:hypothetical protein